MDDLMKKLIKPMIYIAGGIFLICYLAKKPEAFEDYCSYIGYAISGDTIIFIFFERFLWKYIPWNRPPVLKRKYDGEIKYILKDVPSSKSIDVSIEQSWLRIRISTSTDINASSTVMGSIVHEHGKDVLYYTYITEPDIATQDNNPIQHGTCRMVLTDNNSSLRGKYWTTSKTAGDITWKEKTEN